MKLRTLINGFQKEDVALFSEVVLGIPLHKGQKFWLKNAWRPVNILKPANQWGKTTVIAICHIFHAVCKPKLNRFENLTLDDWMSFTYRTVNTGKTYEIARGVLEAIVDMTEGKYLLPDGSMNKSLLSGWAIKKVEDGKNMPVITWWNNSETLIRSYDGLGESFKRLRLAYASADECGDIPELRLFLNGTILPRLFYFGGSAHLIGTPQPKGIEYEELAEEAEQEFHETGKHEEFFVISYKTYPKMAEVYRNDFMPKQHLQRIESIADPELRKQIVYGMYVDYSDHIYTWDEVHQMFNNDLPWDPDLGITEEPIADAYYVFSVDIAASTDWTSCTCIRYNRKAENRHDMGKPEKLKHRVVFHKSWRGNTIPLYLQYEMIKNYYRLYHSKSPLRTKFVFDSGSLGGKNTSEAFRDLNGYPFPPKGRGYAEVKAEGMGKVKEVLSRGRDLVRGESGKLVDRNKNWGGVEASPALKELRRQLETSSKNDDKIRNDEYTSFMQAIHFIESRVPKVQHVKAISFNLMKGI